MIFHPPQNHFQGSRETAKYQSGASGQCATSSAASGRWRGRGRWRSSRGGAGNLARYWRRSSRAATTEDVRLRGAATSTGHVAERYRCTHTHKKMDEYNGNLEFQVPSRARLNHRLQIWIQDRPTILLCKQQLLICDWRSPKVASL